MNDAVANYRVGFIGMGFMGHGMAANLLKSGYSLTVMAHQKRQAVEDLISHGAVEANSPAEVATASDIVFLCVSGAEQVRALLVSENGIATTARPGTIIVDCTTSPPKTLLALQQEYPRLIFVDAPLGRSPREAWEGKLSIMVGADKTTFQSLLPVLRSFASTIQHVGPLGSGHTLKLVNNFVSLGYAAIYSEAITLSVKAGLSVQDFNSLISSSRMHCEFFRTFMGWTIDGDATTHNFSLANANHSVHAIAVFSNELGLGSNLIESIAAIYTRAIKNEMGTANLPELPRSTAAAAGIVLSPVKEKEN
jgi:3-hydroxyisobutyrate dehydrogenase-like beta-hydroxyacid dehydrogenase